MVSDKFKNMPPEEREKLMDLKIKQGYQRRTRKEYLERLPSQLSEYLSGCEFLIAPEADSKNFMFYLMPEGYSYQTDKKPLFVYSEFSWQEKTFQAIENIKLVPKNIEAYFQHSAGGVIFEVDFRKIQVHVKYMFKYMPFASWGLVAKDLSKGIIISHHVGYLPGDYNSDEVVYELGYWGLNSKKFPIRTKTTEL